jgi:Fur family ferric uptake transcriptional regulator
MSCFQTLKEKGYRLTPQRKVILEMLHQTDEHITAEIIYDRVRARIPRANKSTIYRTLELLKKLNLVAETNLGGNSVCYHHIEQAHHHHLVCQECGAIIDLDESVVSPFKDALLREYGFIANLRHLAIFGRCVKCSK